MPAEMFTAPPCRRAGAAGDGRRALAGRDARRGAAPRHAARRRTPPGTPQPPRQVQAPTGVSSRRRPPAAAARRLNVDARRTLDGGPRRRGARVVRPGDEAFARQARSPAWTRRRRLRRRARGTRRPRATALARALADMDEAAARAHARGVYGERRRPRCCTSRASRATRTRAVGAGEDPEAGLRITTVPMCDPFEAMAGESAT